MPVWIVLAASLGPYFLTLALMGCWALRRAWRPEPVNRPEPVLMLRYRPSEEEEESALWQGRKPQPGPVYGRRHAVTGEELALPEWAYGIHPDDDGWFEAVWGQQDNWDYYLEEELRVRGL